MEVSGEKFGESIPLRTLRHQLRRRKACQPLFSKNRPGVQCPLLGFAVEGLVVRFDWIGGARWRKKKMVFVETVISIRERERCSCHFKAESEGKSDFNNTLNSLSHWSLITFSGPSFGEPVVSKASCVVEGRICVRINSAVQSLCKFRR